MSKDQFYLDVIDSKDNKIKNLKAIILDLIPYAKMNLDKEEENFNVRKFEYSFSDHVKKTEKHIFLETLLNKCKKHLKL